MSTHINPNDFNEELKNLFKPRSEEKETKHDSILLMSSFLSEIEAIQEKKDISRKDLAEKIKITPSYLTQVFRNKKPLNFYTLAKIKRALNIRFEVKAFINGELNQPPAQYEKNIFLFSSNYYQYTNAEMIDASSEVETTNGKGDFVQIKGKSNPILS